MESTMLPPRANQISSLSNFALDRLGHMKQHSGAGWPDPLCARRAESAQTPEAKTTLSNRNPHVWSEYRLCDYLAGASSFVDDN
jgi:hypothetical protein